MGNLNIFRWVIAILLISLLDGSIGTIGYEDEAKALSSSVHPGGLEILPRILRLLVADELAAAVPLLEECIAESGRGECIGFLGLLRRQDGDETWERMWSLLVDGCRLQHAYRRMEGRWNAQMLMAELYARQPRSEQPQGLMLYPSRLRFDAEQIELLGREQLIDANLAAQASAVYRQVLSEIDPSLHATHFRLSILQWERLAPFLYRVLYLPTALELPAGEAAINSATISSSVESRYWSASPNLVVLDDVLSPDSLASLLHFAQRVPYIATRPTFVACFAVDLLGTALLAQILRELRAALPSVLCSSHILYNAWLFNYDTLLGRAIMPPRRWRRRKLQSVDKRKRRQSWRRLIWGTQRMAETATCGLGQLRLQQ